jgi:hypothetical protein
MHRRCLACPEKKNNECSNNSGRQESPLPE